MGSQTQLRRLSVRLARDDGDLLAVQKLRWQVFAAEMGANIPISGPSANGDSCVDSDPYDALCDHLLVVDEDGGAEDGGAENEGGPPLVVGTYRLLRESVARKASGFYSEGEFDLSRLAGATGGGELLELGRSCVLPAYRTSATISLLWRGIADYLALHDIGLMFGCASFPGIDPDAHAAALSYLHHVCLAPDYQRPAVLPGKGIALERLPRGSYDERRALVQLPPLIKGYLRAGARFGDGAFVDREFNTIDVCVVMPVDLISERYAARFSVAA